VLWFCVVEFLVVIYSKKSFVCVVGEQPLRVRNEIVG